MEPVRVVVPFTEGKVLKGFTQDFFANKDRFHQHPIEGMQGERTEISLEDPKAVFFIRDFAGNPLHHEKKIRLMDEMFQRRIV